MTKRKSNMRKRAISLVMAVVMCLGLGVFTVPVMAAADEATVFEREGTFLRFSSAPTDYNWESERTLSVTINTGTSIAANVGANDIENYRGGGATGFGLLINDGFMPMDSFWEWGEILTSIPIDGTSPANFVFNEVGEFAVFIFVYEMSVTSPLINVTVIDGVDTQQPTTPTTATGETLEIVPYNSSSPAATVTNVTNIGTTTNEWGWTTRSVNANAPTVVTVLEYGAFWDFFVITRISDDGQRQIIIEEEAVNIGASFTLEEGRYLIHCHHNEGHEFEIIVSDIRAGQPTPDLSTASTWAVEFIARAIDLNLVPQNLQGAYTQPTTRAEFAAFAVALYEVATGRTITGRMTFNDTTDPNVQMMGYLGVVTGVGGGNFNPNGELTREQAAVMIARLANVIGQTLPPSAPTFADNADISSWAVEAVGQMQASGIMGGTGNNNFSPSGDYTREQSIITILRLFDILETEAVAIDENLLQGFAITRGGHKLYLVNGIPHPIEVTEVALYLAPTAQGYFIMSPPQTIMAYRHVSRGVMLSEDYPNLRPDGWVLTSHYHAGLQCTDCGVFPTEGQPTPDWWIGAWHHPWSGEFVSANLDIHEAPFTVDDVGVRFWLTWEDYLSDPDNAELQRQVEDFWR